MTFKETEFVGLFRTLNHYANTVEDPELFRNIVRALVKLYDEVPIYPGIVDMSLNQAIKHSTPADIKPGMAISIKKGDKYISGTVAAVNGNQVKIRDAIIVQKAGDLEEEVSEADVIDFDVLRSTWPTLVFDEEE